MTSIEEQLNFREATLELGKGIVMHRRHPDNDPDRNDKWDRTSWSVTTRAGGEALLLLATGALSYVLLGLETGDGQAVKTNEWLVWRGAASLGVGLAAMLFFRATVALWHLPPAPNKNATAARKPARIGARIAGLRDDENKRPVIGYLIASALLVLCTLAFLNQAVPSPRVWTIPYMGARLAGISTSIALLAIPWIALLLLSENTLRRWRHHLPCATCRSRGTGADLKLGAYLQVWDLITHCLMAFGAFVVIALLPTGALRTLWLATKQEGGQEAFPATDVLLYGAFFATILGVVTIPVLASWRATSWRIVDATAPLTKLSDVDEEWVQGRQRLVELLHLDQGLLRNPLTIFSVFLPLVTAVLAAYLPQLASS